MRKSSALHCKFCGREDFTLLPTESTSELALECKGCYRSYTLKGQSLSIGYQPPAKGKSKPEVWDWSKTDWAPAKV